MRAYLFDKEIIVDIDSECWWIDGMILNYYLDYNERQALMISFKQALPIIVSRVMGKEIMKNIKFID
jgi:hypothetical protein